LETTVSATNVKEENVKTIVTTKSKKQRVWGDRLANMPVMKQ
jgi:hypothetical protein